MRLRSERKREKMMQMFLIMQDKAICDALRKPPVELPETVLKDGVISRRRLFDLLTG